jgi:hypothetical protein
MVLASTKPRIGFTIQLATRVITRGLGYFTAFLISLYSMLMRVGNIMKKRQIAIGIENPANCRLASVIANVGKSHPTSNPRAMNERIQKVRYFSKRPITTGGSSF